LPKAIPFLSGLKAGVSWEISMSLFMPGSIVALAFASGDRAALTPDPSP